MSKSKSGSDRMSLEERLKAFKRRHGIVVSSSAVVNEKVEDVKALERRKQLFMDQTEARRRRSERKSVKSKEIDSKIEHFKQVLSKMKLKREQEEKKQKEDLWKEIEKMSSMVALTLRVDDEEEQREKSKKRKRTKKTNRRLTSSQCRQVEDMFESGSGEDVLVNKYNVAMKRKKLRCLRDGTWLNDEVINFYMKILQEYADTRDEVSQSVHIHNSFFFSKLCREKGGYNYKHFSIFKKDVVFIPINQGNTHWASAAIFMKEKVIRYYDSLAGNGITELKTLQRYLMDEWKDKKERHKLDESTKPVPSDWKLEVTGRSVPQQHNGCDCGVFTCAFAQCVSLDLPFDFSQSIMPHFRRHIALSIVSNGVLIPDPYK